MSGFIVRNNLINIFSNSRFCLATNVKHLINNDSIATNTRIFLKGQQKPINCFLRNLSSAPSKIKPYKSARKYTTTWKLERLMGWSLIFLIPAAFVVDSKELEMALSSIALLHTYWGCQSMCSDYLRTNVVGKILPIIVRLSIVLLFFTSMAGAYQLVYQDVGLINMIKKFWSIRGRYYLPPKHIQKVE